MLIAALHRGRTLLNVSPWYDPKVSDRETSVLELWKRSTLSLPLFPVPLAAVLTIRVPSMVLIKLFNHLLYLKPFNSLQTND